MEANRIVLAAGLILAAAAGMSRGAEPSGLASTAAIQHMIDQGRYRPALHEITRAVDAVNPPTPIDRSAYLLLRADCLLRLRSFIPARQAAHAAAVDVGATKLQKAQGLTLELLILRSPAGRFGAAPIPAQKKPPAGPAAGATTQAAGSMDICEPESRQRALAALYSEEQRKLEPRLHEALAAGNLSTVVSAMQSAQDLGILALGALGTQPTPDALSQLIDRALTLGAAQADSWEGQISTIEGPALEWKTRTVVDPAAKSATAAGTHLVYYQSGPTDKQKKTLKTLADACRGFLPTLQQMAAFGADPEKLHDLAGRVDPLITRCDTMLLTDFSATYLQKPPPHTYRRVEAANPFPKSGMQ